MKRILTLLTLVTLLLATSVQAQKKSFPQADSLINAAVAEGQIPGAVLCVVQGDRVVYNRAYGCRRVTPKKERMTTNTVFDLASVSKVVGTGMTAMTLVDEGLLDPDAKVSHYLPDFEGDATIRDLMTHVSGLPAYATWTVLLKDRPDATPAERKQILKDYVCHCQRLNEPRGKYRYSCLNFITLQYVMEAITGKPLDQLAGERVFGPLKMSHTGYNPGPKKSVAPTEIQPDSVCLWGVVHDPLAHYMNNGVSGNAGVFSTSGDLAKLAKWIFRTVDGKQTGNAPFSRETLELMLSVPAGYEEFERTLAWGVWEDFLPSQSSGRSAEPCLVEPVTLLNPKSVYHTGYTGTFMVVDPEHRIAVILLAHRVHPYDRGGVNTLRRQVTEAVASELLK